MRDGITLQTDFEAFARRLTSVGREQMPFAMAQAINGSTDIAKKDVARHFKQRLDQPRSFTLRGLRVRRASKARPVATLFVLPIQSRYLAPQEEGGQRRPRGRVLLDPVNTRVNRYGNIPRRQVARLLARRDTFKATIKGVTGIWRRMRGGRAVKLLIAFDRVQRYRKRIEFRKTVVGSVRRSLRRSFGQTLRQAIASSKARDTARGLGLR